MFGTPNTGIVQYTHAIRQCNFFHEIEACVSFVNGVNFGVFCFLPHKFHRAKVQFAYHTMFTCTHSCFPPHTRSALITPSNVRAHTLFRHRVSTLYFSCYNFFGCDRLIRCKTQNKNDFHSSRNNNNNNNHLKTTVPPDPS